MLRHNRRFTFCVVLALAAGALAIPQASAAPAEAKAAAKPAATKSAPTAAKPAKMSSWVVDKQKSKIEFFSKFTDTPFSGLFKNWDAKIVFDPNALDASSVTVNIDPASAFTGNDTRDEALPSLEWFDIMKFPKASFVSRSFKRVSDGHYEVTADLMMHGVTHQVVLPFVLTINKDDAAMQGTLMIMRNTFNVGTGYFNDQESIPYEVKVVVTVNAHRAP